MPINVNDNINSNSPKALDNRSGRFIGGVWRPYLTVQEYLDTVNIAYRYETQAVYVYNNGSDATDGIDVYRLVGGKEEDNLQLLDYAAKAEFDAAVAAITQSIATEAQDRLDADTVLQGNIDVETNARIGADADLQTDIVDEAALRASGDATNAANLGTETAARIAGDSGLQSQITILDNKIASQYDTIFGLDAAWSSNTTYVNTNLAGKVYDVTYVGRRSDGGSNYPNSGLIFMPDSLTPNIVINPSGGFTLQAGWEAQSGDKFLIRGVGVIPPLVASQTDLTALDDRVDNLEAKSGIATFNYSTETVSVNLRSASTNTAQTIVGYTQSNDAFGKKIDYQPGSDNTFFMMAYPAVDISQVGLNTASLSFKVNTLTLSSGAGIAIGSTNFGLPTVFYIYRKAGNLSRNYFNATAVVATDLIATSAGRAYVANDVLRIDIVYGATSIQINQYKNGTLVGTATDILPPAGGIYYGSRGLNNNSYFIQTISVPAVTQSEINNVSARLAAETANVRALSMKNFYFNSVDKYFNATPQGVIPTTFTVTPNTTELQVTIASSNANTFKTIRADAITNFVQVIQDRIFKFTFKPQTSVTMGVGVGFGTNLNGVILTYHNSGALLLWTVGGTVASTTARAASTAYAYVATDILDMECKILKVQNKLEVTCYKNGLAQPSIQIDIVDWSEFIIAMRSPQSSYLSLNAYAAEDTEGSDSLTDKIDINGGSITTFDAQGRYITSPAGKDGCDIVEIATGQTSVTVAIMNARTTDLYLTQVLDSDPQQIKVLRGINEVQFSLAAPAASTVKFCFIRKQQ